MNPRTAAKRLIETVRRSRDTTLDLTDLGLEGLPEEICQLTHLQNLLLRGNKLTTLPKGISQLTRLNYLDFRGNRLTAVPPEVFLLKSLTCIFLSENQLAELPAAISQLTKLYTLSLTQNKLTALPVEIGQLTKLKSLRLNENKLVILPEAVCLLTQLQHLYLEENLLVKLPEGLAQLNKLENLELSSNPLTALPKNFQTLTALETLYLNDIKLKFLPDWINQLTKLQYLYLDNNQLTQLPSSLSQLRELNEFSCDNNQLTQLPSTFSQLTELTALSCAHNKLSSLPDGISQLTALRFLTLTNNDALNIPNEVLSLKEPAKILEYYERTKNEKKPINEAKLIFVGRGKVGKTSLVNRLVKNTFNELEDTTHGINITPWQISLEPDNISLNIWDFGGQDIMHSTHQFFMTQRSLYILVLNNRDGEAEADANYWLTLIKSVASGCPVIIALNKIQSDPFDVNRRQLQQDYPTIKAFIETDCNDTTGMALLNQTIHNETVRLKHIKDIFPATWFAIKNRLTQMGKHQENYLTFEAYRQICNDNGETNRDAQNSLALYLHHLGIALNYKDDPRLRDVHVLNPQWVTNGIYRILNSKILFNAKGRLDSTRLHEILEPTTYPVERHAFLLNLMRKFELCFIFYDDESNYLIPQLLSIQQPTEAESLINSATLTFEYHYGPMLPEGLLPRLIVRTQNLSAAKSWRTGAILEFEKCQAVVKANVQDKKIEIYINGNASARRRLLTIIRSDLDHINSSFSFSPTEMVQVPSFPKQFVSYKDLLLYEENNRKTLPKTIDNSIHDLDVVELLNGVDLPGARPKTKDRTSLTAPLKLFYSYSHKDEQFRDELDTHLKILERLHLIQPWHDRKIHAGENWKDEIDDNLEDADIVLLLISADFIASDYCYEKEIQRAMERNKEGKARVIPIILRALNWGSSPISKLQALPKEAKPVNSWADKDVAWTNVSKGIEKVIEDIRKERGYQ